MMFAKSADEADVPRKIVDRVKAVSAQLDSVIEQAKAFYEKKKAPKRKLQKLFKDLKESMDVENLPRLKS